MESKDSLGADDLVHEAKHMHIANGPSHSFRELETVRKCNIGSRGEIYFEGFWARSPSPFETRNTNTTVPSLNI